MINIPTIQNDIEYNIITRYILTVVLYSHMIKIEACIYEYNEESSIDDINTIMLDEQYTITINNKEKDVYGYFEDNKKIIKKYLLRNNKKI